MIYERDKMKTKHILLVCAILCPSALTNSAYQKKVACLSL